MNIISKSGDLVLVNQNVESFFIDDGCSIIAKIETINDYDFVTLATYTSQKEAFEAFDEYIVKPLKHNENTLDFRETPERYLTKEETKQEILNVIQEAKNWVNNLNEETEKEKKLEMERLQSELKQLEIQIKAGGTLSKIFPGGGLY